MLETFDKGKPLLLRTMNGVGDLCWVMCMVARAKELLDIPTIVVKMQDAGDFRDGRASDFVKRFSFVDLVCSERFEVRAETPIKDNRINYVPSGYNRDRSQFTLVVNSFVEWSTRLEEIMPDIPCDWHFLKTRYSVDSEDLRGARELRKRGRLFGAHAKGYICLHFGAQSDNTVNGQNIGAVWGVAHWKELIGRIREESDLPLVIVGAHYDRALATAACGEDVINLCGYTTIGQVIEILRHASLFVSFPSGLPIAAVYMGTPTVCFWNPEGRSVSTLDNYWFSDAFATNWAPKNAPHYRPAVYGRDDCDSVFEKIQEVLS